MDTAAVWRLLKEVHDPEVPVLSILDLGIVRDIRVIQPRDGQQEEGPGFSQLAPHKRPGPGQLASPEGPVDSQSVPGLFPDELEVVITPTYSGCPAMDMIRQQIITTLEQHGYGHVRVTTVLSPAWTTEWMSQEGKEKLKAYGIAPPNPLQQVCQIRPFHREEAVQCPHCGSYHTTLISEFGSTACKALYKCVDCREPFDYFKCH